MKFGKLADITGVDFTLPPDPAGTRQYLSGLSRTAGQDPAGLYLGATGWSMKEWVGTVYPAGTRTEDFLAAYARQFNSIELNTTHYRIPESRQLHGWREKVPADFRFCPKVPQSISHSRSLGRSSEALDLFLTRIALLEDNLGCCFLQLPPYFGLDKRDILERALEGWPLQEIPLAVEFRHPSWFDYGGSAEDAFRQLEKLGAGTVITDVAGRRDVCHMQITAPFTLIRFVGNGLHPTDYERATDWVERTAGWARQGLERLFLFPHQPDNLLAPEMIRFMADQVEAFPELDTRGPQPVPPGSQIRLFS